MEAKSFYRVAHQSTGQGLWYDPTGKFTGLIHNQFTFCTNTKLEMPFDADIVGWLSATPTLDELFLWFTKDDIIQLQRYGWSVFEYSSTEYKRHRNHWIINPSSSTIEYSFTIKPTYKAGDPEQKRLSEWEYAPTPMMPYGYKHSVMLTEELIPSNVPAAENGALTNFGLMMPTKAFHPKSAVYAEAVGDARIGYVLQKDLPEYVRVQMRQLLIYKFFTSNGKIYAEKRDESIFEIPEISISQLVEDYGY